MMRFGLLVFGLMWWLSAPAQNVVRISELVTVNATTATDAHGEADDWVELHNTGSEPLMLRGCYLKLQPGSEKTFEISAVKLPANGYALVFCDPGTLKGPAGHCDAKLTASPGWLGLYNANHALIDSLSYPAMQVNQSVGREQGRTAWYNTATPKAANATRFALGPTPIYCAPLMFTPGSGVYSKPQVLELSATDSTAILWTAGGENPLLTRSRPYTEPIRINGSRIIRAATVGEGCISRVQTASLLARVEHSVPVVSLSCEGWSGFYNNESRALTSRERPAEMAWFEQGQAAPFSDVVALKLSGGASRSLPQKSISLKLKPEFGSTQISFPRLFADKKHSSYSDVVLRNFGNGHPKVFFKDALLQQVLADQPTVDYLAYRTVVVYVNGRYWGLYNAREKKSKRYPAVNYGLSASEVDMVEVVTGGAVNAKGKGLQGYQELMAYARENDLSAANHYRWIADHIDINNFIDYQIAQVFYANTDWPLANIKMWRHGAEGKWRWILFDLDQAMLPENIDFNALWYALGNNPALHESQAGRFENATLLFRKLMANEQFNRQFVTRFCDLLNTNFQPENMVLMADSMAANIRPEMPAHLKRWSSANTGARSDVPTRIEEWEQNIELLRVTLRKRPAAVWTHLDTTLSLGTTVSVQVTVPQPNQGAVTCNGLALPAGNWTGAYFNGCNINLTAAPAPGFRFVRWAETGETTATIKLAVGSTALKRTPVFEPD